MEEKAIKNINTKTKDLILPAVAMRGLVCFPRFVMHFDVAREMSVKAVEAALKNDRLVFLTAQKDVYVEEPQEKDLYNIGVVAEIRQTLKTPDNVMRVLVEGLYRAKIKETVNENGMFVCTVKKLPDYSREKPDPVDLTAIMRSIKDIFETYGELVPRMPKELINSIMCQNDPYKLFENIAYNMNLDFQDKQMLLEESNILSKLGMLYANIVHEVEVLEIEKQIHDEVRSNLDKNQREYYLREQMRVISSQLGEDDSQEEAYEYMDRIYEMNLAPEITEKLIREADRLLKTSSSSQESFVIRNYLDTVLELPWNTSSKTKTDIKRAARILDKDHYGLKRVKERILESIAAYAMAPEVTGQIICLSGPPGVGKTSIGKSIAKALGREYVRVSLGGVRDESDIRGHRKTYIGAMPGRIINAIKQAGTNNPLILFDEIDKMGNDFRGDPASAMLEVLDSEQNKEFRDHYIEVPFDLSDVLFITTANTLDTVQAPLLDRMEVIELSSYTREEKFHIAKEHLIKKQEGKNGLKASQIRICNDAIYKLIDSYTREAGVRNLERQIGSLCRKAAKEIVEDGVKKVTFKADNLEKYLGHEKYLPDVVSDKDAVGSVNGLAWTSVGGVVMPLEVLVLDGKGRIELTGSLGDVMKESAKIAVSYCRSVADKYGIDKDFYEKKDLHIHAPEGAVPKDGPSAGVTMITGIISALGNIKVRSDVAMTGEITLSGKVLPIGGLREKTMAAYKAGVKTIIVPFANKGDLDDVDDTVKLCCEFVFAKTIQDVLDVALVPNSKNNVPLELLSKNEPERKKLTV